MPRQKKQHLKRRKDGRFACRYKDQWFYGFMLELSSNNSLCDNKLTDVVTKIYGLYENSHYKQMTHSQIKRQIMESKGILDHLIEEASK